MSKVIYYVHQSKSKRGHIASEADPVSVRIWDCICISIVSCLCSV